MPPKKNGQNKKTQELLQVSFLPSAVTDEARILSKRKKTLILFFVLVTAVPFLLWLLLVTRINLLKADIKTVKRAAAKIENETQSRSADIAEVSALVKRIAPAEAILQKHAFWSNFFKVLEGSTLAGVVYNNLALDEKAVILSGTARDYETVARQMVAFKSVSLVKDVKVSGLASQTSLKGEITGVNFNFSVILDHDIFKPSL